MKSKITKNNKLKVIEMYNNDIPISIIKNKLNISKGSVMRIAKNGGCIMRHKIVNNIKEGFLIDTTNKINCYLLGLLWADGYVYSKTYKENNISYAQRITLTLVKDDFDVIEPYLRDFGINVIYERQNMRNGKIFGRLKKSFFVNSKPLVQFLIDNDYKIKSISSPTKILNKIPQKLKRYFWRGYIDGDGYICGNRQSRRIEISSDIRQDWTETINLFNNLGIRNYKIKKYIKNNGKFSVIRVCSVNDMTLFGEYLYNDYDNIGLTRKYNKYIDFLKVIPLLQKSKINVIK